MSNRYYHIHGLVKVEVDSAIDPLLLDSIEFQIGHFRTSSALNDPNLVIRPYSDRPQNRDSSIFHRYRGTSKNHVEHTERKVAVETDQTKFTIYTNDPGFLINIYIQLLFVPQGISFIHAAGVTDSDGNALVLAGGGGVGKTSLASSLVRNHDYQWLGDDLVCLGGDHKCFSYPRSFVLKEYHQEVYPEYFEEHNLTRRSRFDRMRSNAIRFVYANAPFMGIFERLLKRIGVYDRTYNRVGQIANTRYVATPPMEELFAGGSIAESGTLSKIVFLERFTGSEFQMTSISKDSMVDRLLAVIHHEWVDYMREFFTLGAFEMFSMSEYFRDVVRVLETTLPDEGCGLLRIPETVSPEELHQGFRRNYLQADSQF